MKFTNLYEAYNELEDFRILILADSSYDAELLAEGFGKVRGLSGEFVVKDNYDKDAHYDCNYVIA